VFILNNNSTLKTITLLLATLTYSQLANATNGYFMSGYSIKSQGMGGVAIALPQDALVTATNPAGIVFVGNRIDLGLDYFKPDRTAQVVGNQYGGSFDANGRGSFLIPDFGVTKQVNDTIGVGLAIYANGGMNTTYTSQIPLFSGGQGSNAGVNLQQLFIAPSIAWKFTPQQSLGVSMIYAQQKFSATGLQAFDQSSPSYTNSLGNVTDKGSSISNGFGANIGWLAKLNDQWRIGLHYQTRIHGSFNEYSGLFADNGTFDIPANYGLGLSFEPTKKTVIALDIQRIEYGNSSSIANPLSNLTQLGNKLGSNGGPGFGWQSINTYKLGVAYQFLPSLTVRTGFNYNNQPIPNSQTFFNILAPGTVQKELSLGFTYNINKTIDFSGFYSHALNQTVYGSNSIPSGFGGGEANIRLSEDYYGLGIGMKY